MRNSLEKNWSVLLCSMEKKSKVGPVEIEHLGAKTIVKFCLCAFCISCLVQ